MVAAAQEATRPASVAVLIDSLIAGGAERVAVEAARELASRGVRMHLIVSRHTGPLEVVARDSGIELTVLGRRRGFAPRQLARAVSVVRSCELVHAHKLAGGAWGVLLGRLARRPVVVHEHTWSGGTSLLRTALYRLWIGPGARRIICVSEQIEASVRNEGVDPAKLCVVANAVPLEGALDRRAARLELGLPEDGLVIGIVGRLRREKRHDLLLEATARLGPELRGVRLCIVGDGPMRPALAEKALALGIGDIVEWAGERRDAGRLQTAFDVAVICSDFEGLPLAALEALAVGTPLVATRVGALPSLTAGGAVTLVEPGDAIGLAAELSNLLCDETRRKAAGRAGRRLAQSEFSFERMAGRLLRVYADALSSEHVTSLADAG